MLVNTVASVNEALHNGLRWLRTAGVPEGSRNGSVLVAPAPVLTVNRNPRHHVLLSAKRDANPFFHIMESMWMLAGRDDLPWLTHYNKRMAEFSDDGGASQPGAYGYRWRNFFGYDQLEMIIAQLKTNPRSRRAVLAMWDAGIGHMGAPYAPDDDAVLLGDLALADWGSKDVPCNTHVYFDFHGEKLNATVCCRSNDIWWGAHGANAVHFSIMLEYVAAAAGLPMGVLRQFSNNYHLYTDVVPVADIDKIATDILESDYYDRVDLRTREITPLLSPDETIEKFNSDLDCFMVTPELYSNGKTRYFRHVVGPMGQAWEHHKVGDYPAALRVAQTIDSEDWREACDAWLRRRFLKQQAKKEQ